MWKANPLMIVREALTAIILVSIEKLSLSSKLTKLLEGFIRNNQGMEDSKKVA